MNLQHGDVLIKKVTALPTGAKPVQAEGRLIVMRGEQTGHNHVIVSDKAKLYELTKDGVTERYLEVLEPVTITHEEHKALPIPEGIYQIGRVQEYDYFREMARQVKD